MVVRIGLFIISLLVLLVVGFFFLTSRQAIAAAGSWNTATDANGVWLYPQHQAVEAIEYGYFLPSLVINLIDFVPGDEPGSVTDRLYIYGNAQEVSAEIILPERVYQGAVVVNPGVEMSVDPTEFPSGITGGIVNELSMGKLAIVSYVDTGTGPIVNNFLKLFDFQTTEVQNPIL